MPAIGEGGVPVFAGAVQARTTRVVPSGVAGSPAVAVRPVGGPGRVFVGVVASAASEAVPVPMALIALTR